MSHEQNPVASDCDNDISLRSERKTSRPRFYNMSRGRLASRLARIVTLGTAEEGGQGSCLKAWNMSSFDDGVCSTGVVE